MQLRFIARTLLMAFTVAGLLTAAPAPVKASEASTGQEMPAFSLRGFDGGTVDIESRRGQPLTAVIFFATWSPRSHQALVDLSILREDYVDKGFDVIMVCSEGEEFPAGFDDLLFDYLEGTNADVPVAMDDGLTAFRGWKVKALPSTFFVDKDLKQTHFIGSAPTGYKLMLKEIIEESLGLAPKESEADAAPTRYQAAKPQMLGYGMAHKLGLRGKSKKAVKKVREVLEADPKFPDAHALLGMLLLHGKKKDMDGAKAAFDKALEVDPELPMALMGKANFTLEGGDFDGAVAMIRDALGKKAWGFTEKPDEEALKELEAQLASATKESPKPAQELLDHFLMLKKKTKVNRSLMEKKSK